jgi:hypothetical protein
MSNNSEGAAPKSPLKEPHEYKGMYHVKKENKYEKKNRSTGFG